MSVQREQLKATVFAQVVKAIAQLGTCRRSKVGCLIVKEGRIISTGYNGSPPGDPHCLDVGCLMVDGHCKRTTHAESNAIAWAARHGISTLGATIFVYGWITGKDLGICPDCSKIAQSAGIVETIIIPLEEPAIKTIPEDDSLGRCKSHHTIPGSGPNQMPHRHHSTCTYWRPV